VLGSVTYDPWGVPTAGTPQPFGFTGELHSAGQVYLRARWYAPGQGRFVSEDPFAGFAEMPYSLHAYQYAYSNPVVFTDPTGYFGHCALSLTAGPAAPAVGGLCVVATAAVAAAAGVSLGAVIACTGGIVCTSTSVPFPGPPVVPGPGPLPPDAQPRVLPEGPYLPQTFDPAALAPNSGPAPDPGPARTPTPMPSAPPVILPHGLDCPTPAPSMTPTPTPRVNLDTGSAIALVSADTSPQAITARATISTLMTGSQPVMARTAVLEFFRQITTIAGLQERQSAATLMAHIAEVPDDPSDRVWNLRRTRTIREPDIMIFGTGDRLGIPTVTTDGRFVRAAANQGIDLNVVVHDPVPLVGQ